MELWRHYEDVAMHFNELLIRLRTQALGALAAIVAAGGSYFGYFTGTHKTRPWPEITVISLLLLIAWCTIWFIDLNYYSRLLRGAVNALIQIEKDSAGEIYLSTRIEEMFGVPEDTKRTLNFPIKVFYVPVAAFLFCALVASTWVWWKS